MMTTTTTTRTRRDDKYEHRYVVSGPAGAIEYYTLTEGQPIGIEHHSSRPRWDGDEPAPCCHILTGPCYPDGTSAGADDLHWEWMAAGRDDDVIWAELESRYAEMAGEAAR